MGKRYRATTLYAAMAAAFLLTTTPARADKLTFDHRLYPALKESLDRNDPEVIAYDASNPRYVVDLILIKGASTRNWDEALQIIARSPTRKVSSVQEWRAEIDSKVPRGCAAEAKTIASDVADTMFERAYGDCPGQVPRLTMTRIMKGKRSLFLLSFMSRSLPDEETRRQWIALLQSAHID